MTTQDTILITGGCGYIGSHITHLLHDAGYNLVVLDNLGNSRRDTIPTAVPFHHADVLDTNAVRAIITQHHVTKIIHLAAFLSVEESVKNPLSYYKNNVDGTRSLLSACTDTNVTKLVFSSTSAVYGAGDGLLSETAPTSPVSPYGYSKLVAEQIIRDVTTVSPLRAVALRYFNVAGADPDGRTGQVGIKAPHLLGRMCQAAAGDATGMTIFGTDYPTPDGTCVRDYIHVSDLAAAHQAVLDTDFASPMTIFNCGYGHGYSVKEMTAAFHRVTGIDLHPTLAPRRLGDAVSAVADNHALRHATHWQPQYASLDVIIQTAWDWYQRERVRVS